MAKRHRTSYKLKEDSLEVIARQLNTAGVIRAKAKKKIDALQKELAIALAESEQASSLFDDTSHQMIYLMKAKNKSSVIVDRVKFTLTPEGKLERQLILD